MVQAKQRGWDRAGWDQRNLPLRLLPPLRSQRAQPPAAAGCDAGLAGMHHRARAAGCGRCCCTDRPLAMLIVFPKALMQ